MDWNWEGKYIVLGVTGSIAAYKAAEIVRRIKDAKAEVQVIMTKSATKFIGKFTFQQLSNKPVLVDMFCEPVSWEPEHIAVADRADLFLIAPATANLINKFSAGIADDMLTTTLLATKAPIVIAPAMNEKMYLHPATQNNIKILKERGVIFIEPGYGYLACGEVGLGRLAEIPDILDAVGYALQTKKDFKGKTVLVTAGATQEPLDPVRYLTNPSSGKMGYALAKAACSRGAETILISGKTHLRPPYQVNTVSIRTADEMKEQVMAYYEKADVVIMAAAVSDFKPKEYVPQKVKKTGSGYTLTLETTTDILAELGKKKNNRILVGFCAETENIIENAKKKLNSKNLDLVIANDVSKPEEVFGSDFNQVILMDSKGQIQELPSLNKFTLANLILDKIAEFFI